MNRLLFKLINFRLCAYLFSWIIFNKEKRRKFRIWAYRKEDDKKAEKVQKNYLHVINRIKNQKSKIKVLFLVSENSKWKAQSLYDLMVNSEEFEPFIVLTLADIQWKFSDDEKIKIISDNEKFFKSKGMNVILGYDTEKQKAIALDKLSPDIVFYQQPWKNHKLQSPDYISRFALSCYIPYYVNNYCITPMDYELGFHKFLYRHYVLNKDWEKLYRKLSHRENAIGLGHTMLDYFKLNNKNSCGTKEYVIYAPHWSFSHEKNFNDENYGTFLKNGMEILEYAKSHKELKWAFKPHPTLKRTLINIGESKEKVEEYYAQWEQIATCCYDASYADLFLNSKVLVTDCGSFLVEYFSTGKPIIHLISSDIKVFPIEPSKKIFDTFYKVHNLEEMYEAFERVIINNDDYMKEERLKMLRESGLNTNNAAENILNDLREILR